MKEILDRIKEFEPVYRDYLLSGDIEKIVDGFAKFHEFDQPTTDALENGVFLFMTFFIDKTGLADFITKNTDLDLAESTTLTEAIVLSIPNQIRSLQQRTSSLVFAETATGTPSSNNPSGQFVASGQVPPPPTKK